eukprot:767032-Hanusia_phi.AAC.1
MHWTWCGWGNGCHLLPALAVPANLDLLSNSRLRLPERQRLGEGRKRRRRNGGRRRRRRRRGSNVAASCARYFILLSLSSHFRAWLFLGVKATKKKKKKSKRKKSHLSP